MRAIAANYKAHENASASSNASINRQNLMFVNESSMIAKPLIDQEDDSNNDEGNIDSEIASSDGNTAINDMDLHKNFNNDKNLFMNDYSSNYRRRETTSSQGASSL